MTSRLAPILWLALALACGSVFAHESIRWAPDINSARRASAEFKVPLLIHFYGDGCLPCKTLEQRVLAQPEIISSLNKFFICVKVNATQDRQLAAEFQVHSWPTDVFVSPDGKTLYQGVCQQEVRAYSGVLENVKVMNRDRNVMLAASQPIQPQNGIAQQAATFGNQSFTPGLLPPGTNLVSSSATPNFYGSQNSGTAAGGQQQLPPSMPPNQFVQSGPLLANTQPSSIGGSTPGGQQQLQGPVAPSFLATRSGELPVAPPTHGRLASPVDERIVASRNDTLPMPTATHQMAQSLGVPQVDAPSTGMLTTVNSVSVGPQAATALGAGSQAMNNPYYQSPVAATAGAGANSPSAASQVIDRPNAMVDNGTISAQQVAFRPRNAVESRGGSEQLPGQPSLESAGSVPQSIASNAADAVADMPKPAIAGYCPIALRTSGGWVHGAAQFAVRHRGRVYWLSSEEARNEFLSDPDKQSPVLSGYDPMLLLNEGRLVEGSVQWGLLEEVSGAFLFFSSEQLKQEYERNFENNTRALAIIMQQAGVK